jgi:CO dehydrogenase maturation factor
MGYTIAIAGKGGTGKTTTAALIVRLLREMKSGSVLTVDADPNSNLGELLGVEVRQTVGGIIDEVARHPESVPSGMTKDRYIEYQIQTSLQEGEGFDLVTMGRPEGPGCYCYVNNVLRNVMANLIKDYDYVVIDNEAGLEHLSRRTTRAADILLVVSDPTVVGLRAASRIGELTKELDIKVKKTGLLINRSNVDTAPGGINNAGLEYLGSIPLDLQISKLSLGGGSLWELTDQAASLAALRKLGDKIWQRN